MIRSPLSLERVAYCSRAVRPELALVTLAEILAVSDRNNRRDNLTGMLLISRGRFFQVLEGAAQDVERMLERIGRDPRHTHLSVVMRRPVKDRLFGQWAMVAARITPRQQPTIDQVIDNCHDDPDLAVHSALELLRAQLAA